MGYYTHFELDVDKDIAETEHAAEYDSWEEYVGMESEYEAPYIFEDSRKWYDYRIDMERVSLINPGILFTLTGYGEEHGDIWRSYFKDGESQHTKAVITFSEFDESKLEA